MAMWKAWLAAKRLRPPARRPPAAPPGGAHYGYAQPGEGKFAQMQEEGISLQEYLDRCEREYLDWALQKYTNTYKAAEVLGTSQSAIMRRKKKHSL